LYPNTNKELTITKKVNLSKIEDSIAKRYLNKINVLQNLQDCENVIVFFNGYICIKNSYFEINN